MKKFLLFCTLFLIVSCQGKISCPPCDKPDGIAAEIGSEKITFGQLDESIKESLTRYNTELYKLRKQGIDDLIEEKLIEMEAKARSKGVQELFKEEISDKVKPVSEEEVKAFFEAQVAKHNKDAKFETFKSKIEQYLKGLHEQEEKSKLIEKLKKKYAVKVMLEPTRVEIDTSKFPTTGKGNVHLVEFSDYQCPYCNRVRETVWQILDKFKGKVKYTFMDFPLSFHADAKLAHIAAHCAADQGKYFEYNKMLFKNQGKLKQADLKKYAEELKLKGDKFSECLEKKEHSALVDESLGIAMKAGVSATPTFFINGVMLSGAQPYEAFEEMINYELKK